MNAKKSGSQKLKSGENDLLSLTEEEISQIRGGGPVINQFFEYKDILKNFRVPYFPRGFPSDILINPVKSKNLAEQAEYI